MNLKKMLFVGMVALLVGARCLGALYSQDEKNRRLLHAVKVCDKQEVQALLAMRASVNAVNENGRTMLHQAALNGCTELMELLLANRAFVNVCDKSGKTALQLAVSHGHGNPVQLLLAHGARISSVEVRNVLRDAAHGEKVRMAASLIDARYNALINQCPAIIPMQNVGSSNSLFLPVEVWEIIMHDFSPTDLVSVRRVSKYFCVCANGLFERARYVRARQLKNELIHFIESSLNEINFGECLFFENVPTRNGTIALLKKELELARGLDVEGLLRGEIICDGSPRSCAMQVAGD